MFIEPYIDLNEPDDPEQAALYRIDQVKKSQAASLNLADLVLGELPPQLFELTWLKELDLSGNALLELPDELARLNQLETLKLGVSDAAKKMGLWWNGASWDYTGPRNVLDTWPAALLRLDQLRHLDLSLNFFDPLPPELLQLKQLHTLILDHNQLGELPAGLFELKALRHLSLSRNPLGGIPARMAELGNLTQLDLSDVQLGEVPKCLFELSKLRELDLSGNALLELPDRFDRLACLQSLHLGLSIRSHQEDRKSKDPNDFLPRNTLTRLPPSLDQLNQLTELDLSRNDLYEFPQGFTFFKNLTSLNLNDLELAAIPFAELSPNVQRLYLRRNKLEPQQLASLARFSQLAVLDLSRNSLKELPQSLGRLSQLTRLDLKQNGLKELPETLSQLSWLTELNLSQNELKELPESLGKLNRLISLNLNLNKLKKLPEWLGKLRCLSALFLNQNRLKDVQESLGKLSRLTWLSLADNGLVEVPESLDKLSRLSGLDLKKNGLKDVPESLSKLSRLSVLNLSENSLKEVPDGLSKLSRLTWLGLCQNGLKEVPESLSKLSRLCGLNLSQNRLKEVPESLSKLSRLSVLDLSQNGLKELPESLGKLSRLSGLYLSQNGLKELPEWLGQLSRLSILQLSDNELKELPERLGKLSCLAHLYLGKNDLSVLPKSLLDLTRLKTICLFGNPLKAVPPEMLGNATYAPVNVQNLFAYLRDNVFAKEANCLREVKLLLVGEGAVGKTQVANLLTERAFESDSRRTEGIAIEKLPIDLAGVGSVQLNLWDFGGQEIMHATHRFFLSERSLYLFVWDSRHEDRYGLADYWLKMIAAYGGGSPVLVVLNKSDLGHQELDRNELRRRYPQIRGFVRLSCKTGEGLGELRAAIHTCLAEMKHLETPLSENWLAVKKELEGYDSPYLKFEEYETICARHGLDEKSREALIRFLHDLGAMLCFRDDWMLGNEPVLRPEWATDGVYRLLNAPQLEENAILETEMLHAILPNYEPEKRLFILGLMAKFELCYRIGESSQRLIPERLPRQTPLLDLPDTEPLSFGYRYEFLPQGLIPRFIVKANELLDGGAKWRSGAVLNQGEALVLVRAVLDEKRLSLKAYGPLGEARQLLAKARGFLEDIHKSFRFLKVQKRAGVRGQPGLEVDYKHVWRLKKRGLAEFLPEGGEELVAVDDLLADFGKESLAEEALPLGLGVARGVAHLAQKEEGFYLDRFEIRDYFTLGHIAAEGLKDVREMYFLGCNGDGKTLLLQALLLALKWPYIRDQTERKETGTIFDCVKANDQRVLSAGDDAGNRYRFSERREGETHWMRNVYGYGVQRGRNDSEQAEPYGFLSLFDSERYLRGPDRWLKDLYAQELEAKQSDGEPPPIPVAHAKAILAKVMGGDIEIEVDVKKVVYIERGSRLGLAQLSEGYRSVLVWLFDLLARLTENQPKVTDMSAYRGVVLVDEIALHLHPAWERRFVRSLRELLPGVQFVMTTHSPAVVLGASEDAVFFHLHKVEEEGRPQVRLSEPMRAEELRKLKANEILTSPLFGLDDARMSCLKENEYPDEADSFTQSRISAKIEAHFQARKAQMPNKRFMSRKEVDEMVDAIFAEEDLDELWHD